MRALGRDPAAAQLNGDDPADDFAALNPFHTQDTWPLVVRFELDRRHIVTQSLSANPAQSLIRQKVPTPGNYWCRGDFIVTSFEPERRRF
jgi:hypothetical protein